MVKVLDYKNMEKEIKIKNMEKEIKIKIVQVLLSGEDLIDAAETCGHYESKEEWQNSSKELWNLLNISENELNDIKNDIRTIEQQKIEENDLN